MTTLANKIHDDPDLQILNRKRRELGPAQSAADKHRNHRKIQYNEQSIDAEQMTIVTRAIDRMLKQHEPYPALVLDRHWYVVRTNRAAPRLFGSFINLEKWPKPRNLLNLMFDPAGLRPFVEEWETVAAGLLQRVRREAVGQVLDAKLQELLKRLREYPGVAKLKPSLTPQSPVLPLVFRKGKQRFSYFSLITTSRYATVCHCAGAACGMHVYDRD